MFQNQDSLSSLQSIAQQAVTSAGLDARVTSPAQRTDPSSECVVCGVPHTLFILFRGITTVSPCLHA